MAIFAPGDLGVNKLVETEPAGIEYDDDDIGVVAECERGYLTAEHWFAPDQSSNQASLLSKGGVLYYFILT